MPIRPASEPLEGRDENSLTCQEAIIGKPQKGRTAEEPGNAGGGECLRRRRAKADLACCKVKYPEVWQRIAQAAQSPGADLRL